MKSSFLDRVFTSAETNQKYKKCLCHYFLPVCLDGALAAKCLRSSESFSHAEIAHLELEVSLEKNGSKWKLTRNFESNKAWNTSFKIFCAFVWLCLFSFNCGVGPIREGALSAWKFGRLQTQPHTAYPQWKDQAWIERYGCVSRYQGSIGNARGLYAGYHILRVRAYAFCQLWGGQGAPLLKHGKKCSVWITAVCCDVVKNACVGKPPFHYMQT